MSIYHINTGKDNHRRYYIETDARQPVAWFDDLYTAAVVVRYLKGVTLSRAECTIARNAMIEFDKKKESVTE